MDVLFGQKICFVLNVHLSTKFLLPIKTYLQIDCTRRRAIHLQCTSSLYWLILNLQSRSPVIVDCTLCSLRWFAVDFFAMDLHGTIMYKISILQHCCRALTLALA